MSKKRRSFTKEFKAKVALEALQERDTLQEIGRKYELHPNQIVSWKNQLKENMGSLFSRKKDAVQADLAVENARLYEEIGRLKMERDWLKKKLDQP